MNIYIIFLKKLGLRRDHIIWPIQVMAHTACKQTMYTIHGPESDVQRLIYNSWTGVNVIGHIPSGGSKW
jgi:hypothetical protein